MLRLQHLQSGFFRYFEAKSNSFNLVVGFSLIAAISILDLVTDPRISFAFFYLLPIAFLTWFSGRAAGIIAATFSAAILSVDQHLYEPVFWVWNTASKGGVFCILAALLATIRDMLVHERAQSRLDHLTGLMNPRAFREIVSHQVLLLQRQGVAYSIGYIDLDDFKHINDHYGHSRGDELLKVIASSFAKTIRKSDVVARMGGDEFVIFFPDTTSTGVQVIVEKLRVELVERLREEKWPNTFSIGVVTCTQSTCDLEKLITVADNLMYEAKRGGKNRVKFCYC